MLTEGQKKLANNEKENTDNQFLTEDSFYKAVNINFEEEFDSYDKKILFEKSTDDEEYLKELENKITDLNLNKEIKESNSYEEKTLELLEKDLERENKLKQVLEEMLNKLEKLNR